MTNLFRRGLVAQDRADPARERGPVHVGHDAPLVRGGDDSAAPLLPAPDAVSIALASMGMTEMILPRPRG
jgi:hypothetical protein